MNDQPIDIGREEATMDAMHEPYRCERCDKVLDSNKIVWLELSTTDGKYYFEIPEDHVSQGSFSFGSKCATIEIKEN